MDEKPNLSLMRQIHVLVGRFPFHPVKFGGVIRRAAFTFYSVEFPFQSVNFVVIREALGHRLSRHLGEVHDRKVDSRRDQPGIDLL